MSNLQWMMLAVTVLYFWEYFPNSRVMIYESDRFVNRSSIEWTDKKERAAEHRRLRGSEE